MIDATHLVISEITSQPIVLASVESAAEEFSRLRDEIHAELGN